MTDLELIEGLRDGDPTACRFFYKKNLPAVKRYILNNSGDEDDAKDIFQETVLDLIQNIRSYKYEHKGNLGGYFFIMVRNKWRDKLDKRGREDRNSAGMPRDEEAYLPKMSIDMPKTSLADFLNQQLNKLGEKCRAVLVATIYMDMSMEKAADYLGFPTPQSVRQKKYTCLLELRGYFGYDDVIDLI